MFAHRAPFAPTTGVAAMDRMIDGIKKYVPVTTMPLSVEAFDMLIERLSSLESNQDKLLSSIEAIAKNNVMQRFCPCNIISIEFHESGGVRKIVTSSNSRCTCGRQVQTT